jgi:hypothetical protein
LPGCCFIFEISSAMFSLISIALSATFFSVFEKRTFIILSTR